MDLVLVKRRNMIVAIVDFDVSRRRLSVENHKMISRNDGHEIT